MHNSRMRLQKKTIYFGLGRGIWEIFNFININSFIRMRYLMNNTAKNMPVTYLRIGRHSGTGTCAHSTIGSDNTGRLIEQLRLL